jgi:hypothetical protein
MRRFSRQFWFTVCAGGLSSVLLTCAVLWFFTSRSAEMVALCRRGKDGCAGWESLQYLFRIASIAQVGGTMLLFGLAYIIGGRRRPPPQPAKDTGQ